MVREWESLNAKAELVRMHRDGHCDEAVMWYVNHKYPDGNKQSHAGRELPKGDDPKTDHE